MPNENAENSAVAIKLPSFWANLPAQWFAYIESQFNTRNITVERTKYDYVIAALPQETISSVFDLMQQISDGNDLTPYTTIKKGLIDRNSLSESARLEALLSGLELGDKKPSEFFRHLKTIAGTSDTMSDKLILNLWMRRLPTTVQATLKAIPKVETTELLTIADNIFEVFRSSNSSPSINSVSSSHIPDSNLEFMRHIVEENRDLRIEINEIKHMISNLNLNSNRSGRRRSQSRGRSNFRSKSRNSNSGMCWYHQKWGNKAIKCIAPCFFSNHPN